MRKYVTPGRTAAFADGRSDFRPAGNRFLPGFIQPENTSYQQKMGELTVYFAQGGQRAEMCIRDRHSSEDMMSLKGDKAMNAQFKKGVLELIVLESVSQKDMYGLSLIHI